MLHRPAVRDLLRPRALDAPPPRDFAGALRPGGGHPRGRRRDQAAVAVEGRPRPRPRSRRSPPRRTPPAVRRASRCSPTSRGSAAPIDDLARRARRVRAPGAAQGLHHRRGAGLRDARRRRRRHPADRRRAPRRLAAARPARPRASASGSRCWSRPTTTPSSSARCGSAREIVGVNARNLGTFAEDLGVGERLAARVPAEAVAIAESAIRSVDDATRMAAAGFDAVLVGEMLVKAADPTTTVRGLAEVAPPGTLIARARPAVGWAGVARGAVASTPVAEWPRGRSRVDLELSDDQELFRETTARFIDARCPIPRVRELADSAVAHDPGTARRGRRARLVRPVRARGARRRHRVGVGGARRGDRGRGAGPVRAARPVRRHQRGRVRAGPRRQRRAAVGAPARPGHRRPHRVVGVHRPRRRARGRRGARHADPATATPSTAWPASSPRVRAPTSSWSARRRRCR